MTYILKINRKNDYMHAVVSGENTRENVEQYLQDILQKCTAENCFRLLIEERLEGPRLGTMDVFTIASEGSTQSRGVFEKIAYVDINCEGDMMKFAETVAVNRAIPVRLFPNVAEAEQWLTAKPC